MMVRRMNRRSNKIRPSNDFEPLIADHASSGGLLSSALAAAHHSTSRHRSLDQNNTLRPMNVELSANKGTGHMRHDSESSEDAPLLPSHSWTGERSSTPRTRSTNNRHRHRRKQTASQGIHHAIIKNSSPVTNVGCCHSGCCCLQCVRTSEVGVLQTFGRFDGLLKPGPFCIVWPCVRIGRLSLRVKQMDLLIETKTKDAVFLTVKIAIQYRVIKEAAYEAFYSLTDPVKQIESIVFDVVRSTLPKMDLDDIFSSRSDISLEIHRRIQHIQKFGFEIVDILITHISPVAHVKEAMNEMNAAKRSKDAMPHRAEGIKTATVKASEANAERAYLSGIGVARARGAIASSLKESLQMFDIKETGIVSPKDVMDLLLVSHYMDTLTALGAESIVLNTSPQEIAVLEQQIATYFSVETESEK